MPTALTPQQSLAMAYARLHSLRDGLQMAEVGTLEVLCADFNRALDDLLSAGFDLSAFKLNDEERAEDRMGWVRAHLNAVLDYMDLIAGLP